jgi:hypothetical protein
MKKAINIFLHLLLTLTFANSKADIISTNINQDIIENTCVFNVIRIKREDIMCIDYGIHKKYCNHFSLPHEFVITSERGVNNIKKIVIKPNKLYELFVNDVQTIANLHYKFMCSVKDNEPHLTLYIVPTLEHDKAFNEELSEISFIIIVITLIWFCILCVFPFACDYYVYFSNFMTGYMIAKANTPNTYLCV